MQVVGVFAVAMLPVLLVAAAWSHLQSSAGVAVGNAGRAPLRRPCSARCATPALYAAAAGVVVIVTGITLPTSLVGPLVAWLLHM